MANGYAKVKDINDGNIVKCARHDDGIIKNTVDINKIGQKMGRVYWIGVGTLLALIGNLIVALVKK